MKFGRDGKRLRVAKNKRNTAVSQRCENPIFIDSIKLHIYMYCPLPEKKLKNEDILIYPPENGKRRLGRKTGK